MKLKLFFVVLFLSTLSTYAQRYTKIPDPNFESALIHLGIDRDGRNGQVLTSSIDSITNLDVSSNDIKDLTGIEDFKSLNVLHCEKNQLTSLDVSSIVSLTWLNCGQNQLINFNFPEGFI